MTAEAHLGSEWDCPFCDASGDRGQGELWSSHFVAAHVGESGVVLRPRGDTDSDRFRQAVAEMIERSDVLRSEGVEIVDMAEGEA